MAGGYLDPGHFPGYVTAALLLALAGWLLALNVRSSAHRVFSLWLFIEGYHILMSALIMGAGTYETASLYMRLSVYGILVAPFPLLYFMCVYPRRRFLANLPHSWLAVAGAMLATVAMQLVAPGLTYEPRPDATALVVEDTGPLYGLVIGTVIAVQCVPALVFAWELRRTRAGPHRAALLLMTVAMLIYPVHRGAEFATGMAFAGRTAEGTQYIPDVWTQDATQNFIFGLVQVTGMLVALVAAGVVLRGLRPAEWRQRLAVGATVAYALALGMCRAFAVPLGLPPAFFFGLALLPLPLLVTYALVRLQLFDLDLKLKWTLKQSTVAAAFIAVFFIASETAQSLFSEATGPIFGIVAAGGLVFVMAPLQRMAERLSDAAMPGTREAAAIPAEQRRQLFVEAHRAAWRDGSLSRDEQRLLERLQKHLGISDAEALALDRQARS